MLGEIYWFRDFLSLWLNWLSLTAVRHEEDDEADIIAAVKDGVKGWSLLIEDTLFYPFKSDEYDIFAREFRVLVFYVLSFN